MDTVKADKYVLKKFGISLTLVLLLITLFIAKKSPAGIWPTFFLAVIFYLLALLNPLVLKPVHFVLMRFGLVTSWIITRFLLLVIFYSLFTPLGLIIRLLGRDPLDRKIDRGKESYWREKEKNIPGQSGYERQF